MAMKFNTPLPAELPSLFAELQQLDAEYDRVQDTEFEALHARHWAVREAIECHSATGLDADRLRAHAALIALRRDPEAECGAPGSFRSIALRFVQAAAA